MSNSLTAQSLFLNSPEHLERYQIALTNVAGSFNEMSTNQAFFDSQIKPSLINYQSVKVHVYKRILSEMIVFNPYVKLNVAKLGMVSAVSGETPRLAISELDILQAVSEQFNDDNLLTQLLSQDILKVTAVFN